MILPSVDPFTPVDEQVSDESDHECTQEAHDPEHQHDESCAHEADTPAGVTVVNGLTIVHDFDMSTFPADETSLYLFNERLGRIPSINHFSQLRSVVLTKNLLRTIEGLDQLVQLEELDLYDNLIDRISGLEKLVNLRRLDLSFNKIRKIEGLETLVNLRRLYLVSNKISKMEGLESQKHLELLEMAHNRVRVIENISHMSELTELWLARNKLTSLAGLDGLTSLTLLSIQSNRISTLDGLSKVPALEELYASHNAIASLTSLAACPRAEIATSEPTEPTEDETSQLVAPVAALTLRRPATASPFDISDGALANVPHLTTLDVAVNRLRSFEGAECLVSLQELWANGNQISDFRDVERYISPSKDSLQTIYLEHNPLRADPQYHLKLKILFPGLTQIDAVHLRPGMTPMAAAAAGVAVDSGTPSPYRAM
ncbi:hypothetical protein H696_05581 [Fonticula alba]|uniref:Protein phosphatase 1 regulatory subunit 7 n=1 Tax=Fonticula alba TaxID=691883 RepID=A0A058Z0R4_FONAL|nr:hypothetical protein H696_05581 [Fonticula alba]KCV67850.1 hypothetical protein H696_05581 [Fonticula alba]|eukprot:XP_009497670.1 hypothetical protein H696_05581 [Fonticula alba]